MTGETERTPSGWTIDTYAAHNEALRVAETRYQTERDRRYAEVDIEKEKALKIKETADLAALGLAREIQTYKDEKANELRTQIEHERGDYATKTDLTAAVSKLEVTIKPVSDYVTSQQGGPRALTSSAILGVLGALGVVAGIYFGTHREVITTPVPTVTVTVPAK